MSAKSPIDYDLVGKLLPFAYGNPGNITVLASLVNKNSVVIYNLLLIEQMFRKTHPEYSDCYESWLWLIYKNICKQNIDSTEQYMIKLIETSQK